MDNTKLYTTSRPNRCADGPVRIFSVVLRAVELGFGLEADARHLKLRELTVIAVDQLDELLRADGGDHPRLCASAFARASRSPYRRAHKEWAMSGSHRRCRPEVPRRGAELNGAKAEEASGFDSGARVGKRGPRREAETEGKATRSSV